MVIYNAATRELTAKIVYYGPGLCGKTTNLKVLHDRLEPGTAGKLLNLQTQTDRTIYFDLLPVELGDIKGYKIRFQLATVPGQTAFNETRRVVLKGVDGIVFVADSQWTMLPKNLEAWQNLKDNLKSNSITFESIPVVIQYNKRDLADILAVDAMQEALGLSSYPFVEAVASAGRGVTETFKLISKLTFVDLLRRLQGRRAEEEEEAGRATQELSREDDLQTWKDSLLKRDSQPAIQRPSRPLSLVPPVPEEAPFDTTELGRGVDDDDAPPYPAREPAEMAIPPELDAPLASPPPPAPMDNPAATVQMNAIGADFDFDVAEPAPAPPAPETRDEEPVYGQAADETPAYEEPGYGEDVPEILSEADEVEFEVPPAPGEERLPPPAMDAIPAADPAATAAFVSAEAARDDRIEVLEQRLQEVDARAGREREASERLFETVAATEGRLAAAAEHLSALTERLSAVERGVGAIHEALGSALQRLAAVEGAAARAGEIEGGLRRIEESVGRLDGGLRRVEGNVGQLDGELRAEVARQRKDSDDMAMALSAITERAQAVDREISSATGRLAGHNDRLSAVAELAERTEEQISALRALAEKYPALEAQIESILHDHRELQEAFEEKTQLGRREAEDIRSQIAPLLEDRVRRHESDAMLFGEMERLRESLAESLHDLAERVRSRVRE